MTRTAAGRRPWSGSTRRRRLPPGWPALRQLARDRAGGRCEWQRVTAELAWLPNATRPCLAAGSDADHIHAGDDHSPANLAWLCGPHHRHKSALEGSAARPRLTRTPERHPGLL